MLVRFWGTRGSLPVALTTPDVQKKLVAALVQAAGRRLDTPDQARAFVERELDFPVSHTFGGNSSCVELETGGGDYVLCDLGSGARAFGNHVLATRGPSGHRFHVFMSHVHWDHIMGFPFFMPAYLPGNHVQHLWVSRGARRGLPPPERGAVVSRGLLADGRPDRVRATRARPRLRDRGPAGPGQAAAPLGRFVRLSVRAGRQGGGLLHRLRAQAGRPRGDAGVRGLLRRRRPRHLRRHVSPSRMPSR